MPGQASRDGFRRRVRSSEHTVDVEYPPARVPAAGTQPTASAPTAPLTGPRIVPTVTPAATTPSKPTVAGLQCLWYDQTQDPTQTGSTKELRQFPIAGWRQGTVAVAAFWLADVLVDPTAPGGATLFADCDAVVHLGRRYRVLGFDTSGSGGALPHAGYLWLGSVL